MLYFFSFLYYTDVGSTFLVILGYYLSLQEHHVMSSIIGFCAVMFRQTNIVWVGFNAAISILQYLQQRDVFDKSTNILDDIVRAIRGCFVHIKSVFLIAFPYAIIFIGFVVFVVKNNGIVVGDRSSHEASLNIPQLFYFSAFVMVFSCFIVLRYLNNIFSKVKSILMSPLMLMCCLLLMLLMVTAVYKFTYVHKYLIADNRHYTFYIWRKIFDRHWSIKYILVPGYLLSWLIILHELNCTNSRIWVVMYLLSTAVVLVPQKLLEFRYFIVPYLLFRLHIKQQTYLEIFIEGAVYTLINAVTLYLFMYRPFYWENEEALQRFMW